MASENSALNGPVSTPSYLPPISGRVDGRGNVISNYILNTIPEAEFDRLRPHLEFVQMTYHQSMYPANQDIECIYFLNRGMASLVVITSDGRTVEVGIVGQEGVVGSSVAVGLRRSPYGAVVQIPGDSLRISTKTLVSLLDSMPDLALMLNRYGTVQGMQVAQLAACNRLHEIEQRLARWMLMCQDRTESNILPMTHEFFAQMLGAGRPSVTLAAGALQRAGIIRYSRGKVNILDRKALENAACECYRVIQQYAHPGVLQAPTEIAA